MVDMNESHPYCASRSESLAEFESAVREYGGSLLAVARRILRNEDDARECVQESYARAFKGLEGFNHQAALRTWLHRIVFNTCTSMLRSRIRRSKVEVDTLQSEFNEEGSRVSSAPNLFPAADALLQREQLQSLVRDSIEALPQAYHTVVLLRDIEGYSTVETADMLDISTGAVKTRLHRARTALKQILESELAAHQD